MARLTRPLWSGQDMNLPPPKPPLHRACTTSGPPDELRVKKGLSPDTLALLKQRGHNIAVKPSMGRTQTIQLRGGAMYGYLDPRNPDGKTLGC